MSRYPEGRRGRGRKPDAAEETATWLLEMEQQAQAQPEDEDWARQLRSTRAASTGQFPPVPADQFPAVPADRFPPAPAEGRGEYPSPGAGGMAPPPPAPRGGRAAGAYPGGGVAPQAPPPPPSPPPPPPARGAYATGEQAGYSTGEQAVYPPLAERYGTGRVPFLPAGAPPAPAPPAPAPPAAPEAPAAWSWEQQARADRGYGTEARGYAAPSGGSGDWAQPQAPQDRLGASPASWQEDTGYAAAPPPEPQPWDTAAGSEQWSASWPFEETTQSWEVDDSSWRWPTQEAASSTGSWDVDPSVWQEDPWGGERGRPAGERGRSAGERAGQGYEPPRQRAETGGFPAVDEPPAAGGYPAPNGYSQVSGYPPANDYPPAGGYPAANGDLAAHGYPAASGYPGSAELPAYGDAGPAPSTGPIGPAPTTLGGGPVGLAGSDLPEPPAAPGLAGSPGGDYDYGRSGYGSSAYGAASGAPAAEQDAWGGAASAWYQEQASSGSGYGTPVGGLEDDEQVVRLGRGADDPSARGSGRAAASRVHAGRGERTAEARRFQSPGEHHAGRSNWPRVVALISWIALLMVVCWFYVFPWLERILPENF